MDSEELLEVVERIESGAKKREKCDRPAVHVPVDRLLSAMRRLHTYQWLSFDFLITHTAIDWPSENRFELVYLLYSTVHGHSLMVSTSVPRNNPIAPTVSGIWPTAEWQEREAYDLFGILYDEHPDLRRVFLEDDWEGFPLRKDYTDPYMLERPQ
jgi:NADH-quinone oxidoreductase subunit C